MYNALKHTFVHGYNVCWQTATLWTLQRISDYIKHGPGEWYTVLDNGDVMFHDSKEDGKEKSGHVRNIR